MRCSTASRMARRGAVIGMVENYLGKEVFRQGVHNYLQAHLYANATAEDFWNAQTANSHLPVDKIMSSFVTQPGVPLLTLSERQASGVPVTQSRFFLSATAKRWEGPAVDCAGVPEDERPTDLPGADAGGFEHSNADGCWRCRCSMPMPAERGTTGPRTRRRSTARLWRRRRRR